jgi:hypothetical protein
LAAAFANLRFWKASSYSPLALRIGRRVQEPVAVIHSHAERTSSCR